MVEPNSLYREYGRRADGVENAVAAQQNSRLLRYYLEGWVPGSSAVVLDIGCGGGDLLFALKEWGISNVRGIDLSPSQVSSALARGLPVELIDAFDYLERSDEMFDAIFLMDVLEHIPREKVLLFLGAIRERLKPGGVLIGQTPNGESPEVGNILWTDATHMWCYAPSSVRQLFNASGRPWELECRESVVPPTRPVWAARWLFWQIRRQVIGWGRLFEHGSRGSGIYSRVFRFRARRLED